MHGIKLPQDQVVPIDAIAPGIEGLRLIFVNVYGIKYGDGLWTLVDSGLPYSAGAIHKWAEKNFGTPPNAIVLTHGHFDHASAAGELANAWDVNVYAHAFERPYLTGEREYPSPNWGAGGGFMSLMSPFLPQGPINLGDRLRKLPGPREKSVKIREMPGWELIATPGHTGGHISLFRNSDRVLLPGDAFCTTKPESFFDAAIARTPELHGPPSYFTEDWESARRSVQALAALHPSIVAPGHGQPLAGSNLPEKLQELSARFEQIAVPANRKGTAA
jgi:glyoxylase-like metal-dependent hydrolase (beta-lactamase superfamily II)